MPFLALHMQIKLWLAITAAGMFYVRYKTKFKINCKVYDEECLQRYYKFLDEIDEFTYNNTSIQIIATTILALNELNSKYEVNEVNFEVPCAEREMFLEGLKYRMNLVSKIFRYEDHYDHILLKEYSFLLDFYLPNINQIYADDLNKIISCIFDRRDLLLKKIETDHCWAFLESVKSKIFVRSADYKLVIEKLSNEKDANKKEKIKEKENETEEKQISESMQETYRRIYTTNDLELDRQIWHAERKMLDMIFSFLLEKDKIILKKNKVISKILRFTSFCDNFATKYKEKRDEEVCAMHFQMFVNSNLETFDFIILINRVIRYLVYHINERIFTGGTKIFEISNEVRTNIWRSIDDCLPGLNEMFECFDVIIKTIAVRGTYDEENLIKLILSYKKVKKHHSYYKILLSTLCANERKLMNCLDQYRIENIYD